MALRARRCARGRCAGATLLLTALLVGPPPAAGQGSPCTPDDPVTAEINAREAIRLAKAGEFTAATALFGAAARLDRCEARYPYLLGRALERKGALDEAEAAYGEVVERFPTSIEKTKAEAGLIRIRQARAAQPEPPMVAPPEPPVVAPPEPGADPGAEPGADPGAEPGADPGGQPEPVPIAQPEPGPDQTPAPGGQPDPPGGAQPGPIDGAIAGGVVTPPTLRPWTTLGVLAGGVGAAIAGAGVYFAFASQAADDELQLAATRPNRARYDALVDERSQTRALSYTAYAVGGALVIGGALLLLVPDEAAPAVGLSPRPGGAMLGVHGAF